LDLAHGQRGNLRLADRLDDAGGVVGVDVEAVRRPPLCRRVVEHVLHSHPDREIPPRDCAGGAQLGPHRVKLLVALLCGWRVDLGTTATAAGLRVPSQAQLARIASAGGVPEHRPAPAAGPPGHVSRRPWRSGWPAAGTEPPAPPCTVSPASPRPARRA